MPNSGKKNLHIQITVQIFCHHSERLKLKTKYKYSERSEDNFFNGWGEQSSQTQQNSS